MTVICITIGTNILILHSRKVFVQGMIKILSIALTHGNPHAKADDAFYACMDTIIENTLDILLSILVLSL